MRSWLTRDLPLALLAPLGTCLAIVGLWLLGPILLALLSLLVGAMGLGLMLWNLLPKPIWMMVSSIFRSAWRRMRPTEPEPSTAAADQAETTTKAAASSGSAS